MQTDIVFGFVVFIISVILHEVAHGYMANYLGDPTARLQGRLTLNPLAHLDLIGSILLPAMLLLSGAPVLGYAKPVPYNPYNLKGKYAELLVAAAGPGTNILLALLFSSFIRFGGVAMTTQMVSTCAIVVLINLRLALFNLIPIPPLDGSKVFSGILGASAPGRWYESFRVGVERMGIFSSVLLVFVLFYVFFATYFSTLVVYAFSLLTGL